MSSLYKTQPNGFQLSYMVDKGIDFYKLNYQNDGHGRDNYIQWNNGGLCSQYSPSK